MTKDQDPNKKYYFTSVRSSEERISVVQKFHQGQSFILWERGRKKGPVEEFSFEKSEQSSSLTVYLSPKGNFFHRLLGSKLVGKEVFFWTEIRSLRYFSFSVLEARTSSSDPLGAPFYLKFDDLYVAQKRKNYRLDVSDGEEQVFLGWKGELFPVKDISVGGLSIFLSEKRFCLFEGYKEISGVFLSFRGEEFPITRIRVLKVLRRSGPVDGVEVRIKFEGIDHEVEEKLVRQILEEAQAREILKSMSFL